jgi:hypothetical protein
MKFVMTAIALFSPALALAHGSAAHQASEAVEAATKLFTSTQSQEIKKDFLSVSATKVGYEQFNVVITLKERETHFNYFCQENETVNPVVWECKIQ